MFTVGTRLALNLQITLVQFCNLNMSASHVDSQVHNLYNFNIKAYYFILTKALLSYFN